MLAVKKQENTDSGRIPTHCEETRTLTRTSKTGMTAGAFGSAGASVLAAPAVVAPAPPVFVLRLLLTNITPMTI